MTPEQQKEELSRAWATAVTARCGFTVGDWSQDQGCLDFSINAAGPLVEGGLYDPTLSVQLKCTDDKNHLKEKHVSWELSRSHYDLLRGRRSTR